MASVAKSSAPSLAYVAFITVCVVWGTTYLAIRIALETVPVLLLAGLRWTAAGVIMSALMLGSQTARVLAQSKVPLLVYR